MGGFHYYQGGVKYSVMCTSGEVDRLDQSLFGQVFVSNPIYGLSFSTNKRSGLPSRDLNAMRSAAVRIRSLSVATYSYIWIDDIVYLRLTCENSIQVD